MINEKALEELWAAYTSPFANTLLHVLGDIQKDGYPQHYHDWKEFVSDVMEAMEVADSGEFPDAWYPPEDDEK